MRGNGCRANGAVIAWWAVLSEGSTVVFGPRGSLTEFAFRLEGDGEDGGARKRARGEGPAPPGEELALSVEPQRLSTGWHNSRSEPQVSRPPQPPQPPPRSVSSHDTDSLPLDVSSSYRGCCPCRGMA